MNSRAGKPKHLRSEGRPAIKPEERLVRLVWVAARMRIEQLDIAAFRSQVWRGVKKSELPLDSPLFIHIAGLARVPALGLTELKKGICHDVAREWRWYEQTPVVNVEARKLARGQAATLRRLSAELAATLETLNDDVLGALTMADLLIKADRKDFPLGEVNRDDHSRLALGLPQGGEDFDQIKKAVATLTERASKTVDIYRHKSRYLNRRPARGGFGEPPGEPGSLTQFALRLLWDVRTAGGRLTLDKNNRKGTLIETLELLSPHLPPGFIPKILPVSTLAKMHALDKKLSSNGANYREFLVQILDSKFSSN
jgi:hypothetical protein